MTRFPHTSQPIRLAVLTLAASLAGCSTVSDWFGGSDHGYRSQARQVEALQVPPDLSQLNNRTVEPGTVISAAAMQTDGSKPRAVTATPGGPRVALNAVGDVRFEHLGNERWVHSALTPEQIWPQVRNFWAEQGMTVETENAETGLMETAWYEDRSKLPNDIVRNTLGKIFDNLWDSGLRDKYRTRLERDAAGGTNVYISQQGMAEVFTDRERNNLVWRPRPNDPQLEALMLSRLMLKLGAQDSDAKAVASAAPAPTAKTNEVPIIPAPRSLADVPNQIEVADGFDRAWRRVAQSLDRHGFTVEDRDRPQGLFYLRYADPTLAGKEEPNFFQKLFGAKELGAAGKYRVKVQSAGEKSTVLILDNTGKQVTDENAKRILQMLLDDLR
ncbi:MAG: outer membrane protein assembly factor BamC [Paucibacter sp.]|nr:outer membrane protein assembly factor BamC [Roseateles sp.]